MKGTALGFVKTLLAPRSLRYQLLARSLFILAGLLLLIGALQYVLMKDFLYRNQADTISIQTRGLPRDLLERSGRLSELPRRDINQPSASDGRSRGPVMFLPDMSLAFIGTGGEFLDLTEQNGMAAPHLTADEYVSIMQRLRDGDNVPYRVTRSADAREQIIVFRLAEGPRSPNGLIQLGASTSHLQDVLMRQLLTFAALVLLAITGGFALYLPVLRRTLHPLHTMVKIVERTDAGNLHERLPASQGQLEIDRLARSFNGMLERLNTSFEAEREAKEQMRRFIADASHELRTPLTSIHGFLEVLLRGAADNREQLEAALRSMHGESTRIKKLVEDLLTLAKLDRAPRLEMERAGLDELITDMEPHLRMLAGSRFVSFDLSAGADAVCDPDKIKQVILNLFQNAVQHTDPDEGEISVTLTAAGKWAHMSVRDNGAGIAEDHLPHLFERFYRSDSSRTRKQGGSGLGLAISQSIVQAHGGHIQVDSRPGQGSLFTVFLPLGV